MISATFQQGHGLDTVLVTASCLADASAKRDGKSGVVASVANGSTGIYAFTLAYKYPQLVHAVGQVQSVDATPIDITCQTRYDSSTGILYVYTLTAAVLSAPEAGSRVGFVAVFSRSTSLKD